MAEPPAPANERRRYRLRARADAVARTRQRITRAAIELHGSVGPAATTMSAVAERAGVTRATLYRHFADAPELFAACSAAWLAVHGPPDIEAWAGIADPRARVRVALRELYGYYRSTETMLSNLLRDLRALPEPQARGLAELPGLLTSTLERGWEPTPGERLRHSAIAHAVAFATWRSLRDAGLGDEEAAALMAELILGIDDGRLRIAGIREGA